MRLVVISSLAVVLLGAGIAVGVSWRGSPVPRHPSVVRDLASVRDSCQVQELVLGVRGSGKIVDQEASLGSIVDSVYHRTSSHLAAGRLVAVPVDHMAASVVNPATASMYRDGLIQGREQLVNALYLWNHKCLGYRFANADYSQGADVAADVVDGLDRSNITDAAILDKVDGVALLGEPRCNPADTTGDAVAGVTHADIRASATAALAPFPIKAEARPPFTVALAGRVHSWCQAMDSVCAFDSSRVLGCVGRNVFKINDTVTAGLECLRTFLGPHFIYREAGRTEAAGAWLAGWITGAPGWTTPPAPLPPAIASSVVAPASAPVPAPRTTTSGSSAPSTPPTVPVAPPAAEIDPNPPQAQDPGPGPFDRRSAPTRDGRPQPLLQPLARTASSGSVSEHVGMALCTGSDGRLAQQRSEHQRAGRVHRELRSRHHLPLRRLPAERLLAMLALVTPPCWCTLGAAPISGRR
ncbi:cutinase family protein [Amycolatopsis eburnea]|uniref:cutinase family protein n=1 Tax=Amycolatopsis eburnea TaxID=2267691 RepID=UPI001315A060|nr:cutinase family protein [Amycolatopsis eburnea]